MKIDRRWDEGSWNSTVLQNVISEDRGKMIRTGRHDSRLATVGREEAS